jgi:hypothetical protein
LILIPTLPSLKKVKDRILLHLPTSNPSDRCTKMIKGQKSEFFYLPYFNNRPQFRLITHELILAHDLPARTL